MSVKPCGEVSLGGDSTWRLSCSCRTSARLLTQLLTHNQRALVNTVLPSMGIDPKDRRTKNNLLESGPEQSGLSAKESLAFDKGMAMELLVSSSLTGMDSPAKVTNWCLQSEDGQPRYFAPSGFEDILASYGSEFRLVVEVTAKRQVNEEDFKAQVDK